MFPVRIIEIYWSAVARMAAAKDNAVCAASECAENEHRVYSARAGHADYFNVGRVIKSVVSRKVGAGIRAPVAAKRHYKRLIFVYLHIASTSAIICLFIKPFRSIAPDIHATVQAPQP